MKKLILALLYIFAIFPDAFCDFPPDPKNIPNADFICYVNGVTLYALKNQYVAMESSSLTRIPERPRVMWEKLNLCSCFTDRRLFRFPLCIDLDMTVTQLVCTIGHATGTAPIVLINNRRDGE